MPKVLCHQNVEFNVGDDKPRKRFEAGKEYELSAAAWRYNWSQRQDVFTLVGEPAPKAAPAAEPTPDARVMRGADLDDSGVEAARPNAFGSADFPRPESLGEGDQADLAAMTRDELIDALKERGVELPRGYLSKGELVEMLKAGNLAKELGEIEEGV